MYNLSMNYSKKYCTIYVIRHGESVWNFKGLIQGRSDSKLTKNGESQAHKLANELKNIKFDAVYSSRLLRAKRTAEIVSLGRSVFVKTSKALIERNFGKLDGRLGKHIKIFYDLQKEQNYKKLKLYGIENDEEIVSRMFPFLTKVAKVHTGKNILVVTHGSIVRTLIVHLGYATLDQLPPFSVGNASFVKLESNRGNFVIKETKGINFNFR